MIAPGEIPAMQWRRKRGGGGVVFTRQQFYEVFSVGSIFLNVGAEIKYYIEPILLYSRETMK